METRDNYAGCPAEVAEALKAGKQVKMWVWSDIQNISQDWITRYEGNASVPWEGVESCYTNASLTDPRIPAKPDPRDYIGKWGVFWDVSPAHTGFIIDKLGKLSFGDLKGFFLKDMTSVWKHFAPCDTIPTDPDKWPDDMLIFGPEDVR